MEENGTHSRIVAVVKPFRLDAVLLALGAVSAKGVCWEEVRGYGRQKGHLELYSGAEYSITFLPKVRVECLVPLPETERAVEAIRDAARTGRIGDGKIFVMEAWSGEPGAR